MAAEAESPGAAVPDVAALGRVAARLLRHHEAGARAARDGHDATEAGKSRYGGEGGNGAGRRARSWEDDDAERGAPDAIGTTEAERRAERAQREATQLHGLLGINPAPLAWESQRMLRFHSELERAYAVDRALRMARTREVTSWVITALMTIGLTSAIYRYYYNMHWSLYLLAFTVGFLPLASVVFLTHVVRRYRLKRESELALRRVDAVTAAAFVLSFGWLTNFPPMYCTAWGEMVPESATCVEAALGHVSWQSYCYTVIALFTLLTQIRPAWHIMLTATFVLNGGFVAFSASYVDLNWYFALLPYVFGVCVVCVLAAYHGEKEDRTQFLLRLLVVARYEQVLKEKGAHARARMEHHSAEAARDAVRRTLGYTLHECGNALHGLQAVVLKWQEQLEASHGGSGGLSARSGLAESSMPTDVSVASIAFDPFDRGEGKQGSPSARVAAGGRSMTHRNSRAASTISAVSTAMSAATTGALAVDHDDVRILAAGISSLRILCSDGLDAQKLAAGRLRVHREPEDVVSIAFSVARAFQLASSVTLLVEVEPSTEIGGAPATTALPSVWVDAHRVRQILANGVSNAVKVCERGTITVRVAVRRRRPRGAAAAGMGEDGLESPALQRFGDTPLLTPREAAGGGESERKDAGSVYVPIDAVELEDAGGTWSDQVDVLFAVEDTGPGLQGQSADELFEDFAQSQDIRVASKGSGLGLPLARRLVHMMGGDIGLEEDHTVAGHDSITRFWFTLPGEPPGPGCRAVPHSPHTIAEADEPSRPPSPAADSDSEGLTVLTPIGAASRRKQNGTHHGRADSPGRAVSYPRARAWSDGAVEPMSPGSTARARPPPLRTNLEFYRRHGSNVDSPGSARSGVANGRPVSTTSIRVAPAPSGTYESDEPSPESAESHGRGGCERLPRVSPGPPDSVALRSDSSTSATGAVRHPEPVVTIPVIRHEDHCATAAASGDRPPLRLHVLVVDDEMLNRKIATRMLESMGCSCVALADGDMVPAALRRTGQLPVDVRIREVEGSVEAAARAEAAVRRVMGDGAARPFDCMLLDSMLARTHGPEVASHLRAARVAFPIFAVTSNAADHDLAHCEAAGMTAVLPKPFTNASMRCLLQTFVLDARARLAREGKLED
mmetsp:Transcript_3727/g.13749  ORF Transcript_3727/g.13749 Transcript_3727/m.13749 type:complete len:1131 (-) Transcript_3727:2110-5502(-)